MYWEEEQLLVAPLLTKSRTLRRAYPSAYTWTSSCDLCFYDFHRVQFSSLFPLPEQKGLDVPDRVFISRFAARLGIRQGRVPELSELWHATMLDSESCTERLVERGPGRQPLARVQKRIGHGGGLDGSHCHKDRSSWSTYRGFSRRAECAGFRKKRGREQLLLPSPSPI